MIELLGQVFERLTPAHDAIMAAGYIRTSNKWEKEGAPALKVIRMPDGTFQIVTY